MLIEILLNYIALLFRKQNCLLKSMPMQGIKTNMYDNFLVKIRPLIHQLLVALKIIFIQVYM